MKYVMLVCNGLFVFVVMGVFEGKCSVCYWVFVNKLVEYGVIFVFDCFVEDDNGCFMSGGGVMVGIDFVLCVVVKLCG